MKKIFVNNIGDLGEIQRASFYRFIRLGITEELIFFPNPFSAKLKIDGERRFSYFIYHYPNEVKLKGPNFPLATCLKRDCSYTIQLYIPGEYSYYIDINSKQKKILSTSGFSLKDKDSKYEKIRVKQDIFFGEIPLMTEEGTFVISGYERIVISQIIRSPGIYFRKEFGTTKKTIYSATIISNKGLWTKFILDEKENKSKKTFSLKKNKEENFENGNDRIYIKLNDSKTKSTDLNDEEKDSDSHKIFIFDLIRYFGLSVEEMIDSLKYSQDLKNFQLIRNLEKKENANIEADNEHLYFLIQNLFRNTESACFSIGEIGRYKANKKFGINLPSSITYLTSHDFLGIIDGLIALKYYDGLSDDIDDIKNKQIRSVGELLQIQLRIGLYRVKKSFEDDSIRNTGEKVNFDLEPASDPEDWVMDPRLLTSSIKEFFKTSQLSQFMDQTNPLAELTHKRRISVFGPNGLKRDHISTVIRDIHPSQYGKLCPIETPEGQNAGLLSSISMFGRLGSIGLIETPYFFMDSSRVFSEKTPIFLNAEEESEITIASADICLNQRKEIPKGYLPTKSNNNFLLKRKKDVSFITTSPIQIVSLATSLIPFLEHDDANRALMGSNMQRQAVPLVYTQKPLVGTGLEITAILDSGMVIKNYCEGSVKEANCKSIKIEDNKTQNISYKLRKYIRSNQETSINQKPIVWIGEKVFAGQIIADGPSTNDGELALGRNLTIAYMPWEGYNYEDAIIINERLIFEDCLTSIHIEELETNLTYWINGSEKLTKNLAHLTNFVRRHLDDDGIVKIGSYVKEHDILVGKLTPCEEDPSPEAKLLRALYGQKEENYKDTSLRVPLGTEGRIIDVRIISTTLLNKEEASILTFCDLIRIYVAQIRKIHVGDKLAGRHGNKGIISRVLSRQDMPYLPDGKPIDILLNPLGVPSRMNLGQIFESLLGLAAEELGKRYKILPFDEMYGKEASRILVNQKLKEAALKSNQEWFFNFTFPGKILLRDGRTGEYFDNPVTVGKTYILKLIHLVEDKIHARATGPYSMITEQPLAGKSQKGGQRFGEMEVWALEAYGASNTLQELLTIKSDDIDGRNDIYESILIRRETEKPNPCFPEAFLALIRELNSLGLEFSFQKLNGGFYSTNTFQEVERDIFSDMETRLKLRALLARKKAEDFAKSNEFFENKENIHQDKLKEKEEIKENYKTLLFKQKLSKSSRQSK